MPSVIDYDADGNPIDIKDGFRARRKRQKGWLTQAIKDGSVRDPDAPDDDQTHTGLAVHAPTAKAVVRNDE